MKHTLILSSWEHQNLKVSRAGVFCLRTKFPLPTGKKNKLRVYYLSWLRNRILHNDPEVEKKQGWITVGDLEGCIHYKVGEWPFWEKTSKKMHLCSQVSDLT